METPCLGPATCREPGKRPGPPPATVMRQTVIVTSVENRSNGANSRKRTQGKARQIKQNLRTQDPTRPEREVAPDLVDPNRKVIDKARLPDGQPVGCL